MSKCKCKKPEAPIEHLAEDRAKVLGKINKKSSKERKLLRTVYIASLAGGDVYDHLINAARDYAESVNDPDVFDDMLSNLCDSVYYFIRFRN